ncbi:hypothetical protein OWM54_04800 [Myxococcus sp. MISCRS1]|jgi:hypothetical protein|uniref:hypothetical protein n=1 Tax=Myxococcus TaxID=32 RepID=UPI0011438B8A|nr:MULTISPECIES: hypothetical protein [Myxococcus]BDT33534.1 hypothetical protein MFMH1_32030 [Myxococcus sp. MH1]MBZ4396838.1 hypothetical protein [Myxococcus sp. AS-1-15]MBZ4408437.1 hypothetical protein [Myxococcus sp. XM-1-1-1]MCK8496386.1 hypothetical protein [Myxococcus fulvus]MCY0996447.1 hypothetical protein [Myxococcus sp. MISCRS1]
MAGDYDFDDDDAKETTKGGRLKEFDCPGCDANNPVHDGFGDGDELRCNYCGCEYKVKISAEGRAKFKEI